MAVGTGGMGQGGIAPPIFCQPKTIQSLKTTTYTSKSVYSKKSKYAHSSVDIGNHRYRNVQNDVLLKYKCDKRIISS